MPDFLNNIINSSGVQAILENIYNLNSSEISVLIIVLAVLLLFLAYRMFGAKTVFVLMLLYLIIYVLYINDIFGTYEKRTSGHQQRMQTIEDELEKSKK